MSKEKNVDKEEICEALDISDHQGAANIKTMHEAGYQAVILRAGYGKNNIDQRFAANALACYNLFILAGIYWFSYALNAVMAAAEATYAIAQAAKYWSRCPIAYDLEYDTRRYAATKGVNITKELATDMAIAFLTKVRDAGYVPVLYSNRDYLKNYFDLDRIRAEVGDVKLWYAVYANSIPAAELNAADLWQYTSKGRVPGISGNVDINRVYTDIWGSSSLTPSREPVVNLYIQSFQAAANADGYRDQSGSKLAEDGQDGPRTQYVRRRIALQRKRAKLLWTERSSGKVVEWLQGRLNEVLGVSLAITGEYDDATRAAVGQYQERYGLTKDYVAGYNTLQSLFYN